MSKKDSYQNADSLWSANVCFDYAVMLAREGNHVAAYRWYRLAEIWLASGV